MEVDRVKLFRLMEQYCEGNYNRFGKELGIDASHLYRFLNTGVGGGKKLVGAVLKYCKIKGLNFEDYINFM